MQFRLRTLFILTAVVAVFCGLITAPPFIAIPVFCALSWLAPAFWIPGVIYGRDSKRAFFIGGVASGAIPYVMMLFYSFAAGSNGWNLFGYRNYNRAGFGEHLINLFAALLIFAPALIAFFGGLISVAVYRSLQPQLKPPPPASPFGLKPLAEKSEPLG